MENGKRCAYLTMDSLERFFCSDSLTLEPLFELGWQVENVPWRTRPVDWSRYDVVVIRSPWDYSRSATAFLHVLESIEQTGTPLANPLATVRWNIDKHYLLDFERAGISVVPTLWFDRLQAVDLTSAFDQLNTDAVVVKPTVGAGADDTFRLNMHASSEGLEAAAAPFRSKAAMVQPFLRSILDEGEYSMFYFGGEFSHAVQKRPKAGDFRVQEEHGGIIRRIDTDDEQLEVAGAALSMLQQKLLYARVDLVRLNSGKLAVIELELIEPSLYFDYDERSPVRFAKALNEMFG